MAVTFVGASFVSEPANTNDLTVPLPSGWAAGDLFVLFGRADENTPTLSLSTGTPTYTVQMDNFDATTGTTSTECLWTRIAQAGETAPVVQIDISEQHSAALAVYRTVDNTTPLDVAFVQGTHFDETANNQTGPNPPVTTVTDGAAVVLGHGLTTSTDPFTNGAAGAPSGYELAIAQGAERATIVIAHLLDAGTFGTKTPGVWTHTGDGIGGGSEERMWTIALRPHSVSNDVDLASSGTSSASATATLDATLSLTSSGTSSATATASNSRTVELATSGTSSASATATLARTVELASTGTSSSSASAALSRTVELASSGTSSAAATATLARTVELASSGTSSASATATLDATLGLASAGTTSASATGVATKTGTTVLVQEGFRWGTDDGTEAAHGWEAAQDTDPASLTSETTYLLRVIVDETGAAAVTDGYKLQYKRDDEPVSEWRDVS